QSKTLLSEKQILPHMELASWDAMLRKETLTKLETKIFPAYMMQLRWFGGKGRSVESMEIVNYAVIDLPENNAVIFLVHVTYQSGLPDIYQLPVAFAQQSLAVRLQDSCPKAIIATLTLNGVEGVLYDALYGAPLQEALLTLIGGNQTLKYRASARLFRGHADVQQYLQEQDSLKPKVLSGEQSNTSIVYGSRFFLKIFRKVDRAINPDLEITRFLTQNATFR